MTCKVSMMLCCLFTAAASTSAATPPPAGADAARGIPEQRQTKLLEKFGEAGIDADKDGTLTRKEVRAFFQDSDRPMRLGDFRGHGGRHPHGGPMGRFGGRFGGPGAMMRHLDAMKEAAGPAFFSADNFADADQNEDGVLDQEEWALLAEQAQQRLDKRLAEIMPTADADEDGLVSSEELEAFRSEHRERVQARILENNPDADTDGDGALSDEEVKAFHDKMTAERRGKVLERYPEADTDGDGVLSDEELRSFRSEHPQRSSRMDRHRRHGSREERLQNRD